MQKILPILLVALCGTTACDELPQNQKASVQTSDLGGLLFTQNVNEFAGTAEFFLQSTLWLDRSEGHYLRLKFQCYRDQSSDHPSEMLLALNASNSLEDALVPEE